MGTVGNLVQTVQSQSISRVRVKPTAKHVQRENTIIEKGARTVMTAWQGAMAIKRASPTGRKGVNCARLVNIRTLTGRFNVNRASLASTMETRAGPLVCNVPRANTKLTRMRVRVTTASLASIRTHQGKPSVRHVQKDTWAALWVSVIVIFVLTANFKTKTVKQAAKSVQRIFSDKI